MKKFALLILLGCISACAKPGFSSKWTKEQSPESFITRYETSKGSFDIQVERSASPKAVDRYYQLVKHHFYDHSLFYRVVPNFVAQYGSTDSVKVNKWSKYTLRDEPVIKGNIKGTLSFARAGKDSRGTELYINLKDNHRLDTLHSNGVLGFPTFGQVIRGMDVVASLYYGYGNSVFDKFDTMYLNTGRFLQLFPKLDSIQRVYILKN
jgi:peptidyl-prolyl cis-trans isomerase A (cyclophilin A)